MQPSSRLRALENTPFIHGPSIDPRSAVGQLLMGVVLDLFLRRCIFRNWALQELAAIRELIVKESED